MLRSEDGPWKLYKRGPSYRIGRKAWWGVKWLKTADGWGGLGLFAFKTRTLTDAQRELKRINEQAYDKKWYKENKWEVKK